MRLSTDCGGSIRYWRRLKTIKWWYFSPVVNLWYSIMNSSTLIVRHLCFAYMWVFIFRVPYRVWKKGTLMFHFGVCLSVCQSIRRFESKIFCWIAFIGLRLLPVWKLLNLSMAILSIDGFMVHMYEADIFYDTFNFATHRWVQL